MFFVGIVWCLIPASKILNRHLLMILKITDTPFFFVLLYFTSLFIYIFCCRCSTTVVPIFHGKLSPSSGAMAGCCMSSDIQTPGHVWVHMWLWRCIRLAHCFFIWSFWPARFYVACKRHEFRSRNGFSNFHLFNQYLQSIQFTPELCSAAEKQRWQVMRVLFLGGSQPDEQQ